MDSLLRDAAGTLAKLPMPSERRIALHVTPDAQRQLMGGHPWLYDGAIRRQSHEGKAGDLAVVFDRARRFLAIGLYDPASPIRVRILQHRRPAPINRHWFNTRLSAAINRRTSLSASQTTGYRLVHGENDGLPGLIVDRYERTLVLKLYTAAWVPHLRELIEALAELAAPLDRLILRLSRAMQEVTEPLCGLADGTILIGAPLTGPVLFRENGLRFEVDPIHGQKTGFFLDQRENRARVMRLAAGCTVLDVFAYVGAFSVYAARGGAREVVSLEASRPALAAAERNMALNRDERSVKAARQEPMPGDAFEQLPKLAKRGRRFDVVILDPPTFAKTIAEVRPALQAYARLTRLGLGVLRPGGTLVISSCSGQVSAEAFFTRVLGAAARVGRPLKEFARSGHPLDHPIGFPEGAYLKCLFARAA